MGSSLSYCLEISELFIFAMANKPLGIADWLTGLVDPPLWSSYLKDTHIEDKVSGANLRVCILLKDTWKCRLQGSGIELQINSVYIVLANNVMLLSADQGVLKCVRALSNGLLNTATVQLHTIKMRVASSSVCSLGSSLDILNKMSQKFNQINMP